MNNPAIHLPTAPELQKEPIAVIEDVAIIFPGDAPRFLDIRAYGEYREATRHKDERPEGPCYVVETIEVDGGDCYSPLLKDWVQEPINK